MFECMYHFEIVPPPPLNICPEVEFMDGSSIIYCFEETLCYSLSLLHQFAFLKQCMTISLFMHVTQYLLFVSLSWMITIMTGGRSIFWFWFALLWWFQYWISFNILICFFASPMEKICIQVFSFLNQIVCLLVFDIKLYELFMYFKHNPLMFI